MGTVLTSLKKKELLVNVCTFMCGLFVGGVMVYLVNANHATDVVETVASNESDYPDVV